MSSPCQPMFPKCDKALKPKLDVNVGARSHFFQPPASPSTSSLFRSSASPNKRSSGSYIISRKRARPGDSGPVSGLSSSINQSRSTTPQRIDASTASSVAPSPAPFVNTRYRVAGGVDTPTAAAESLYDRVDQYGGPCDRRNWRAGTKRAAREDDYDDYGYPNTPVALGRERNGHARTYQSYPAGDPSPGWRKTVFNAVGTVAGTLWHFCWTKAFRGFSAGGGQSYMVEPMNEVAAARRAEGDHENSPATVRSRPTTPPSTRPFDGRFMDDLGTPESTPPRPAKKIQREKGGGEWVMVNSKTAQKPSMSPMYMTGNGSPRRRVLHSVASRAGRPAAAASGPASFASPRKACSPAKEKGSAHTEAQRLVAKRARQERQVDASIQKFNDQLKAMIREGKEALGTRIEVDDEIGGPDLEDSEDEYLVDDDMAVDCHHS